MTEDTRIAFGSSIKALGSKRYGGYLVAFTDENRRDLVGEYFTKETNFLLSDYPIKGVNVLYNHGLDDAIGVTALGRIDTVEIRDKGIWAEFKNNFAHHYTKSIEGLKQPSEWKQEQLSYASEYEEAIDEMLQAGKLGWSSGALPQSVRIDDTGFIRQWGIIEGSETPTPAMPLDTRVLPLKSLQLLPLREAIALREAAGTSTSEKQNQSLTLSSKGHQKMDEQEIRDRLDEAFRIIATLKDDLGLSENGDKMDMPTEDEMKATAQEMLEQEDAKALTPERVEEIAYAAVEAITARKEGERITRVERAKTAIRNGRATASQNHAANTPAPSKTSGFGEQKSGNRDYSSIGITGLAEKPSLMKMIRDMNTLTRESMKAQNYAIGSAGGFVIREEIRESLIPQLRDSIWLDKVGAKTTFVPNNAGVQRPRLAASPAGRWVGINQQVQQGNFQFEMLTAVPKPVAAEYAMPIRMMDTMYPEDETTLRNELIRSIALAINYAAERGTGATVSPSTGAEPLGILNTPGVTITPLSTNGRNPTPKDMSEVVARVQAANVELGDSAHWVYHPNVKNYFEDLTDTTGQLLNRSQWTKGYEPVTSTAIQTGLTQGTSTDATRILFGDWSFFEIVMSREIELVVMNGDTFMRNLQVGVMAYTYVDFLVHQAPAFQVLSGVRV
jgi:HK97 family phage major capsid protein